MSTSQNNASIKSVISSISATAESQSTVSNSFENSTTTTVATSPTVVISTAFNNSTNVTLATLLMTIKSSLFSTLSTTASTASTPPRKPGMFEITQHT